MVTSAMEENKVAKKDGEWGVGCRNLKQGGQEGLHGEATPQEEFQEGAGEGVSHAEPGGEQISAEQEVQRS